MDNNNFGDEASKFLEGFRLVYNQTKSLLERFEVKEIDCLDKELIIVDEESKRAYPIVSRDRRMWWLYSPEDIVPESRDRVWAKDGVLRVTYSMTVEPFNVVLISYFRYNKHNIIKKIY